MTRIAFIDYFPAHYRRGLYEAIGARADVDFFFYSDQNERWSDPNISAVWDGSYRRVDLKRFRLAGQPLMPGVLARIAGGQYEAVIKSPNGKLMFPLTYAATRRSGAAFVLWTEMWYHPRTAFHRLSKRWMEAIYRQAGAIVVPANHVRSFVLETPGVDAEKIFMCSLAVDPARFEQVEPQRNGEVPEILYVGQFQERKGIRYLLEAFDNLGVEAKLRLIGGGPEQEAVRERLRGRDDIEIVGYRTQDELPAEMARARCLVLPSVTTAVDREPWGLVVNEALHAGLPVVATDAVGAAAGGLVRDGRNGFIVPERHAGALADALRRLVSDPELATQMGEAGRVDVATYNYARMADAFIAAAEYAVAAQGQR